MICKKNTQCIRNCSINADIKPGQGALLPRVREPGLLLPVGSLTAGATVTLSVRPDLARSVLTQDSGRPFPGAARGCRGRRAGQGCLCWPCPGEASPFPVLRPFPQAKALHLVAPRTVVKPGIHSSKFKMPGTTRGPGSQELRWSRDVSLLSDPIRHSPGGRLATAPCVSSPTCQHRCTIESSYPTPLPKLGEQRLRVAHPYNSCRRNSGLGEASWSERCGELRAVRSTRMKAGVVQPTEFSQGDAPWRDLK